MTTIDPRVTEGPLVIADACRDCGSRGTLLEGGKYVRGEYVGGTERPCPRCAARTALAMLLVQGWTPEVRWDQVVRYEYGDEVADLLVSLLNDARIPVAECAAAKVSERGVQRRS